MATTFTPLGRDVHGGMVVEYGTFTSTVGSADATHAIGAGIVFHAVFESQDTSPTARATQYPYSVSTSSGLSTLTVYCGEAVTVGRYMIFYR